MSEIIRISGQQISFRDNAFDTGATEKFCLVVVTDKERLTLAVLDNLNNDFLAFESWYFRKAISESQLAEQIERLCNDHPWLTGGFKRIDIAVTTEKFTLVPAALFDSSSAGEFLSFNTPFGEGDVLRNDILRQADARIVYAFDKKLEHALNRISPTVRIKHHLSSLIEKVLAGSKNKNERRIHAHIRAGQFDLIVAENGKLLLANIFSYHSPEDFIYFILFAAEQLKMNPETFLLEISGEAESDSAIIQAAKKYVRNVSLAERQSDSRFAAGFDQFPAHFHYNLFALHYFS